jgi:predicted PurR-regulated permease PerM
MSDTFQQNLNGSNSSQENQLVILFNKQLIKKIVKLGFAIALCAALILAFPYIKPLLGPLGIALVLTLLLNPLIDRMENISINRGAAIAIVFLVVGAVVFIGIKTLIPGLNHQIQSVSKALENNDTESIIDKLQITLTQQIPILKNPAIARQVSKKLHLFFTALFGRILKIILKIISSFTLIIIVPFMTFFFLKDGRTIKKSIIHMVPNRYFEMSLSLLHKTSMQLGRYIRGQLLVSSIIATLSTIAMYSLDIPYFFIIGLIAGLANMIPYFGPVVGSIPGVLVAIIEKGSMEAVVGVIIAFAFVQLLDNILVSPLIVSRSVQIHPLLVIIVILIGSNIAGILGMLVAVPIFAVIQVIIKEIIWSFKNYRLTG